MKFFFLILVLLLIPFASADNQFTILCGGDSELQLFCFFGDSETAYFGQEFIDPVVSLESPINNAEDTDGILDFYYNVTDSNSVNSCSLWLDGSVQTDSSITKSISQHFQVSAPPVKDSVSWLVSCTDKYSNQGNSTTYYIDTKEGEGTPTGGGGGGSTAPELNVSEDLCILTYESALDGDYSKISDISDAYVYETQDTVSYSEVRSYIDNWQSKCSNLLELTLKPQEVCSEIYYYTLYHEPSELLTTDLLNMKNTLSTKIIISMDLLEHYFYNYNELCFKQGLSDKMPEKIIKKFDITEDFKGFKVDTELSGIFDISIPLPLWFIGEKTDGFIEGAKYIFRIGTEDNQYYIDGFRLYLLLSIIIIIILARLNAIKNYLKNHKKNSVK